MYVYIHEGFPTFKLLSTTLTYERDKYFKFLLFSSLIHTVQRTVASDYDETSYKKILHPKVKKSWSAAPLPTRCCKILSWKVENNTFHLPPRLIFHPIQNWTEQGSVSFRVNIFCFNFSLSRSTHIFIKTAKHEHNFLQMRMNKFPHTRIELQYTVVSLRANQPIFHYLLILPQPTTKQIRIHKPSTSSFRLQKV